MREQHNISSMSETAESHISQPERPLYWSGKGEFPTFTSVPQGWLRNTGNYIHSVNMEALSTSSAQRGMCDEQQSIEATARLQQEQRWREATGIDAKDAYVTVVIPIHNEEKYLQSTLDTFMLADIPSTAHVRVLFITNGCTDTGASGSIIRRFMEQFGDIREASVTGLSTHISDQEINPTYEAVDHGSWEFIHMDTPVASKANALNIANSIALERPDEVIMNLDSNNFIEPDAITNLYRDAYDAFIRNPNRRYPVGAVTVTAYKSDPTVLKDLPSELDLFEIKSLRGGQVIRSFYPNPKTIINGRLFAWEPRIIETIGGIPKTVREDKALSIILFENNFQVLTNTDSNIWAFMPSTIESFILKQARFVRGALQLLRVHPELKESILQDEVFYFSPAVRRELLEKWAESISLPKEAREKAIAYMVSLWDGIVETAYNEDLENPDNYSWTPITDTK